jgi:aspartyl-tRNA(Asn)/glutamyl-tRNA(Gln) amidotransferase subunit A
MYLADSYTVAVNLAGLPAISVPAGWVERNGTRLPVGLQVIGKWFEEDPMLDFAEQIEEAVATNNESIANKRISEFDHS